MSETVPPGTPPPSPPPDDNRRPGGPTHPPTRAVDDLMHLADSLGFQSPARRDPSNASAMAFVAVDEPGGPVPNVPAVRARDDGRAVGAVGAATFTLPPTLPPPRFGLPDATCTRACQQLAAEMDAWRGAKVLLACPCLHCTRERIAAHS